MMAIVVMRIVMICMMWIVMYVLYANRGVVMMSRAWLGKY